MKKLLILSLLALGYQSASAQLVTESFGSGANAFTMDFVTIRNPGNSADSGTLYNGGGTYSAGSVSYVYNIGKYEISRRQIETANSNGSLGITMLDMTPYGGNGLNRPATGITWFESGKFANYLNRATGNKEAYKFDANGSFQLWSPTDQGYNSNNPYRNSLATFWIPSTDEWYKAAYGSPSGNWYKYPTGKDTQPIDVASGTSPNTAVYSSKSNSSPADIDQAGGLSNWETMGQGGNVWEWTESAYDGWNNSALEDRVLRGAAFGYGNPPGLQSSFQFNIDPSSSDGDIYGFRIAMIPEPSSLSLLLIGVAGMASRRLLKQRG